MSVAFVQYARTNGGAVNTVTSGSMTFTAGNLIVVNIIMGNANEQIANTVTDTLGNTYHRLSASHGFNPNVFSGAAQEIWYAYNVTGGTGTVTASWTQAGGFGWIDVAEYSGLGTSDPIDTSGKGNSTGSPLAALTLAQTNELVVGFVIHDDSGNAWVWTDLSDRTSSGKMYNYATADSCGDYQPASSGSYNVTGTGGSGGTHYVSAAAAFKTGGGGGGGAVQPSVSTIN